MNISLNPWYFCNFRCGFCYLSPEQLADKTLLPISTLDRMLVEIQQQDIITHVDVYGGEPTLLPKSYVYELKECLVRHGVEYANINTNLSAIPNWLYDDFFDISVSYDFTGRERSDQVWMNMCNLNKPFSILMLVSDHVVTIDPDYMIRAFNTLSNLQCVELKPYSTNQINQLPVSDNEFEIFVQRWLSSRVDMRFDFTNKRILMSILDNQHNSFSDDHVYITPAGKFAVLEFDEHKHEYFQTYDTYSEYKQWCVIEHTRVISNTVCSSCDYLGRCASEHLRPVAAGDTSCNGYKNLIRWYHGRMAN